MNTTLSNTIASLQWEQTAEDRKAVLEPLISYIRQKANSNLPVNLNFICTHNSRRSHLSQVWAQAAAAYFGIANVACYSGGTEETALYPKVAETMAAQGFSVLSLSGGDNPVYAIKYDGNSVPVIGFSKKYDSPFNPDSAFAAIMTCSQADGGCPFIAGAEKRIAVTYEDPKVSDGTPQQEQVYAERSLQIAAEMFYVFSQISK
ncbi:protein-tyrosine-phosphatase [Flavobacterium sp. MFBS3-15]|uniref:arsenate-mycothiol transferase ArsC n=1 Tax=Flavobacterium sp. MFBS3-15 TaxID=2989816 RepID=UPI0022366AB9|nr:protein-tyrosine-phosphatase [Flavobacterium sp. MFBS3-15]MCW4468289.1 protein-tyrosine-phosphatase [Flavobacterium sp. MFBS3-15]